MGRDKKSSVGNLVDLAQHRRKKSPFPWPRQAKTTISGGRKASHRKGPMAKIGQYLQFIVFLAVVAYLMTLCR